eukprot:89987_1
MVQSTAKATAVMLLYMSYPRPSFSVGLTTAVMDGISRNDIGDATGLLQVYKSESVNGIQDTFYMNHAFRNVIANKTKMNMTKQGISLLVAVKEGANNVKKLRLLFKYKYIKEYCVYSKNPRPNPSYLTDIINSIFSRCEWQISYTA